MNEVPGRSSIILKIMDFYQFNLHHTQYIEDLDFEVFNFEYCGPHKFEFEVAKQEEPPAVQEVIPPEYLERYHQQADEFDQYILYRVEMDDSIFGLELKFDVRYPFAGYGVLRS